ncbi:MAG TPA: cytidylate kinase family protein [Candidatus Deferrimicrobiaceae bacterium]|nr:cytidylate kinase family protein [Candidatus Deferrimicrobiaceae bacterium]
MAIVTISRECGSGGEEIGKAVAQKLGYEYVTKKLLYKDIELHGQQWLKWAQEMDEHAPSIWERFDRSFAGFTALVEHCIYERAWKNSVVILGRGGNWLLKDIPYALRVRIIAPLEDRIRLVGEREGVNREVAEKLLMHSDHERAIFLKRMYHRDWSHPDDYDMTFNTSHLSFKEVVDLIIGEIPARDKRATPEARERLRQLTLAARVKSDIRTDFHVFIPTLEVVHDGTVIILRGVARDLKQQERVLEIARRAAGTTKIRSELHVRGT